MALRRGGRRRGAATASARGPDRLWRAGAAVILEGKRSSSPGVVNRHSIAYAIAERAQRHGAEVVLTSFGRVRRMTERAAKRLPSRSTCSSSTSTATRTWPALDRGARPSAGTASTAPSTRSRTRPPDALGGEFLAAPRESARMAFETSAYSLKALASARRAADGSLERRARRRRQHRRARLRRLGRLAGLRLDGRRQGRARVGLALPGARPRARAAFGSTWSRPGPISTPAASGIPGFENLAGALVRRGAAGLGQLDDAGAVADVALFLLSDLGRAISGEIVHADGGFHALGSGRGGPARRQ